MGRIAESGITFCPRARRMREGKIHGNRVVTEFGPELHEPFLDSLRKTGLWIKSARSLGCDPEEVRDYRKNNPAFEALCKAAAEEFRESYIETAYKLGVTGYKKPIIGGKDRNEVVAEETVYEPSVLCALLKQNPDGTFTDRQEVTLKGAVDIKAEMDLAALSTKARKMLRELLEQVNADNEARQRGEAVE